MCLLELRAQHRRCHNVLYLKKFVQLVDCGMFQMLDKSTHRLAIKSNLYKQLRCIAVATFNLTLGHGKTSIVHEYYYTDRE